MNPDEFILAMLVNNEAGVLTRVSGLFARRVFNIDSLSVGVTDDPRISRITITARGDDYVKTQLVRQLEKLHDVKIVEVMPTTSTVMRELVLIKLNIAQKSRAGLMEAVAVFRAKVVDLTNDSVTLEITGERSKCNAFVEYLRPFGIAELCRTGLTAMSRGRKTLKMNAKPAQHT
ncbi:MAG: acetolactate synthase small subunit [Lentisphaerae bacterium]|jgi:acetolactate synthase-1/3 small subunit|nr:acetolactate synthase small subunit [Lentisphaerota bacterium]